VLPGSRWPGSRGAGKTMCGVSPLADNNHPLQPVPFVEIVGALPMCNRAKTYFVSLGLLPRGVMVGLFVNQIASIGSGTEVLFFSAVIFFFPRVGPFL